MQTILLTIHRIRLDMSRALMASSVPLLLKVRLVVELVNRLELQELQRLFIQLVVQHQQEPLVLVLLLQARLLPELVPVQLQHQQPQRPQPLTQVP